MTLREFLQSRRKEEYPVFTRVLKALPTGRFDYRPHERSAAAGEIVWTLALETKACCELVDTGWVNWKPDPPPAESSPRFKSTMLLWMIESHGLTIAPGKERSSFSPMTSSCVKGLWVSSSGTSS
jgi:hypothetical protein